MLKKIVTKDLSFEEKIYYIFGFPVYKKIIKLDQNGQNLFELMQRDRFIRRYHSESFGQYRNSLTGKTVVIVATGKSLNKYRPIDGAVHIGVNKAFLSENVPNLDFYFLQDYSGASSYIEKANSYHKDTCKKFYGYIPFGRSAIPRKDVEEANAKLYLTTAPYVPSALNFIDISCNELPDYGSVVFAAFAFALWTHPKKIMLVGCDCSNAYFDDARRKESFDFLIEGWKRAKKYSQQNFPDIKICSINPIGLKGIFEDIYM